MSNVNNMFPCQQLFPPQEIPRRFFIDNSRIVKDNIQRVDLIFTKLLDASLQQIDSLSKSLFGYYLHLYMNLRWIKKQFS